MKRIPIITIILIILTTIFIGCSERTSAWLPDEITITQEDDDTRIYKFLYNTDNQLIGFDIIFTHLTNGTKAQLTDSIRFKYGKDGRLVHTSHISGNPDIRSKEASIYYLDENTIQLYAPDSTKTTLTFNDHKQLLSIEGLGYEAGYLYDSLGRVKSIAHNILPRDTASGEIKNLFKISMDYQHQTEEQKNAFEDIDFPEWILLYYGLEALVFTPSQIIAYPSSEYDHQVSTSFSYEYNKEGFPTKIKMEGEDNMLVNIKYRGVK